jgi:hypothetical protein
MKRRLGTAVAALLLVVCLTPGLTLAAAAVLDQHNNTSDTVMGTGGNLAQTFKVGKTGKLTEVALWMYTPSGTATISVYIEPLTSGHPSGTHLTSGSATVTTTDAWVAIPVTAHAVSAGQQLAIVYTLSAPAEAHISWKQDSYPNGAALNGNLSWDPLQGNPVEDLDFRTYVVPAPKATPKPTVKATPTPSLAPSATASPTAAPTDTPTAELTAMPSSSAAASIESAVPSAIVTPGPAGSGGSGGSGDPPTLPILGGIGVVVVVVGGVGLALARRRG